MPWPPLPAVPVLALVAALGLGCSGAGTSAPSGAEPPATSSATPAATSPAPPPDPSVTSSATPSPTPSAPPEPVSFDADRAARHVRVLAGRIGPRLATGPAFRRAAAYVAHRLRAQGYDVTQPRFPVPAGSSWGVPVAAGTSSNVVARPAGFDPGRPHLVVGAHLDTVAVAPGAEDNASGVSVLLELARLAAAAGTRLPVVLIAFGGEEPRGPGDDQHHFGSLAWVDAMSTAERRGLRAMVSLDRVGVGTRIPVCTGPLSPARVRDDLLATARRLRLPTTSCGVNTASDHWSFEQAGFAVARVGGTSYAGYHSAGDVPSVVDPAELGRVGRLIWGWTRDR